MTDECIVLQTQFGSKTDRLGHRSPPVTLRKCEEESLCPVRYVSAYKERTEPLRQASGTQQLFISPFTHRPVNTETVAGEGDAGSRSDCISGFNEGHGDQLCPATRRALTITLELSGLDKGRHGLPSLRACSTRADSSFHFVSALLARRCVSST